MKLWFIYRLRPALVGETKSFVLREKNEVAARKLAASCATSEGSDVWMDPNQSSCERVLAGGKAHFLVREVKYET